MVGSANLNDCSAFYDNVAVEIDDARVAALLLDAERALAEASGATLAWTLDAQAAGEAPNEPGPRVDVTPLMGAHIKTALLRDLEAAGPGDELLVGMLFLSERAGIDAIVAAHSRGAVVHVVLDSNRRSFGAEVGGFPNRVVARELRRRAPGISVRWHDSEGEFHTKIVILRKHERRIAYVGSANLTRRSLLGTNLETNVRLDVPDGCRLAEDLDSYALEIRSDRSSSPATDVRAPWTWRLAYLVGERLGSLNC
jgi:phosphatidylserine/phosphatidylglycerophosphate/cardiolipin synthase-like enzyme